MAGNNKNVADAPVDKNKINRSSLDKFIEWAKKQLKQW